MSDNRSMMAGLLAQRKEYKFLSHLEATNLLC